MWYLAQGSKEVERGGEGLTSVQVVSIVVNEVVRAEWMEVRPVEATPPALSLR